LCIIPNCHIILIDSDEAKPKISFPFFVGSPHTPRRIKSERKENFWFLLPRPQGADEARIIQYQDFVGKKFGFCSGDTANETSNKSFY